MPRNRAQHQKGLSDEAASGAAKAAGAVGVATRPLSPAGGHAAAARLRWSRSRWPGIAHERHVTGADRASARHPAFRRANTILANIKNSLLATHRVVEAKHLPRYLGAFAWRFNRRFVLKTIHERLASPQRRPYRLLKLAEPRW